MKKLSMFLFISWSIMLVLILTFGVEIAGKISTNVSEQIYEEKNKLEDVYLTNTEYLIEETNYLKLNIVPDTHNLDDLVFTSLNPEVFEIIDEYSIRGKRLDTDQNKGILLVTSKTDPTFEKQIELTFVKRYPTSFEFLICDAQHLTQTSNNVYLNHVFFLKANLTPSPSNLSEDKVSFIYDETYFQTVSKSSYEVTLKPKCLDYQIGDYFEPVKTEVKMVLNGDVVSTKEITINPILHAESFDVAMFAKYPTTHIDISNDVFVKERFYIEIYENNKKLLSPFEISTDNSEIVKINSDGSVQFLKVGNANLTISLKNGYSKTYSLNVRNKVLKPNVSSELFNENNELVVKLEMTGYVYISFPSSASFTEYTYKLDNMVAVSESVETGQIAIYGRAVGTYNLEILVDEGTEEPIVLKYVIKVIENENAYQTINKGFSKFLAKILGHMAFFVLQGILAILMIKYHKSKQKLLNYMVVAFSGILTAWTSEFIQFFIPGRFCSIDDVMIDLTGYLIGICIGLIFYIFMLCTGYLLLYYQKVKKEIWADIRNSKGEYKKEKRSKIMKTILITGVSSGIGAITKDLFLQNGYHVIGLDINECETTSNFDFFQVDITNVDQINELSVWFEKQNIQIDTIINIAGIHKMASLVEDSYNDIQKVININLLGPMLINNKLHKFLKSNGRIIIVTSEVAGFDPLPFNGLYSVSKIALEQYAQALRQELNLLNQKVITIMPGAVQTPLQDGSLTSTSNLADRTILYKKESLKFVKITKKFMGKPLSPSKVGKLLVKVTNKKHPKLTYKIHRNIGLILLNILPKRLQCFIIKTILK